MDGGRLIMPRETSMQWSAQFRKLAPRRSRKPSSVLIDTSSSEAFLRHSLHLIFCLSSKAPCCPFIGNED